MILWNKKRRLNNLNLTPLHYAIARNLSLFGKVLISKGADINAIDIIDLNKKLLFLINII